MLRTNRLLVKHKVILILMLAGFVQIGVESLLGGLDSFPDTEGHFETLHWLSGASKVGRIQ